MSLPYLLRCMCAKRLMRVRVYIHTCMYVYVCMYVCMYVYIYIYIYIYICLYICVSLSLSLYIYIYILYVYTYTYRLYTYIQNPAPSIRTPTNEKPPFGGTNIVTINLDGDTITPSHKKPPSEANVVTAISV